MSIAERSARRIRRREMHSPRSLAAIVIAVALVLTLAWLGLEILLGMLNRAPLLVDPARIGRALERTTAVPAPQLASAGIVIALIGLVILVVAIAPGRRSRHVLDTERAVTIVDDEVIASAVARRVSAAAGTAPDNVRVTVSRRGVDIRLTPTSGVSVDEDRVLAAAAKELGSYLLWPALRPPRLRVEPDGAVGA